MCFRLTRRVVSFALLAVLLAGRLVRPDEPSPTKLKAEMAVQLKQLEDLSRKKRDDDPELQEARKKLAKTLRKLGELKQAKALYKKVLDVASKQHKDDDRELAEARTDLANVLSEMNDYKGARDLYKKVLTTFCFNLPDEDSFLSWVRDQVGLTYYSLKEYGPGLDIYEKILEVKGRKHGQDHIDVLEPRIMRDVMLIEVRRLEEARSDLEKVVQALEQKYPQKKEALYVARENLHVAYLRMKKPKEALEVAEKNLSYCEKSFSGDARELQAARVCVASEIWKAGELERAKTLLEKAIEVYSRSKEFKDDPSYKEAKESLRTVETKLREKKLEEKKGQGSG